MRILLLLLSAAVVGAFVPVQTKSPVTTALAVHRRDVLLAGLSLVAVTPAIANAKGSTFFFDEHIEDVYEPAQQATNGKLDLNSAFVGEYKNFPGMFPHAAGQIASHGPYQRVSDIYKISTANESDKQLFKKYEKNFTVNPPGRAFDERINARVST